MPNRTVSEHSQQNAEKGDYRLAPPIASIIIPAFNVEDYIQRAIASSLEQTVGNIEVIVVDDASQDATLAVAQAFAATDSRVRVIASAVNQGAAAARNLALDAARGDWIALLDADDWFSPQRLEVLLRKAQEYSADMMADDLAYVNNMDSEPWSSFVKFNGDTYTGVTAIGKLFYLQQESKSGKNLRSPGYLKPIIRRSLIEANHIRYKDTIRLGQDFFFFLDCLICGARFFLYPKAFYYYRARPESLTTKSRLERAVQAENGLYEVLTDERVKGDFELHDALLKKLDSAIKRRKYSSVAEPLRRRQYFKAMAEMFKNPYFFVRFCQNRFRRQ
jgi:succinoglycan biosynthesis protein ExoO